MKRIYLLLISLLFASSLSAQNPQQPCDCPYPVIFLHGYLSNNGDWFFVVNDPEFSQVWGGITDTFQAVINAQVPTDIAGLNGIYGDNGLGLANDDDVLTWFTNESNQLRPGCLYSMNFENFWNESQSLPELFANDGSAPIGPITNLFHSDGNESAILKQGAALGRMIEQVLAANPDKDRVLIVGHSMGGLEAREYLQRTQDDTPNTPHRWWVEPSDSISGHRVAKLVTLGTPHLGSNFAGNPLPPFPTQSGASRDRLPDVNSEAVRDLRYNHLSTCGILPCVVPSPYLFGGDEDDLPTAFWTNDVNCNGSDQDVIEGINLAGNPAWDGTTFNPSMPLPTDIRYTYICSDVGAGGDLVVDIDRQWIYAADSLGNDVPTPFDGVPFRQTDTIMTDVDHVSELLAVDEIVRGLDEGDYPKFAWELKMGNQYGAMAQIRASLVPDGNPNNDPDWFYVSLADTMPISIELFPNPRLSGRIDLFESYPGNFSTANATNFLAFPANTLTPLYVESTTALPAGDYFIRVQHDSIEANDWTIPYKVRISPQCGKDPFEPNDDFLAAAQYPSVGVHRNANICERGDEDWFWFDVKAAKPHVRVLLSALPANYDLQFYDSTGTLVANASEMGLADEEIIQNGLAVGRYRLRVYSKNPSNWSEIGYRLIVHKRSVPFSVDNGVKSGTRHQTTSIHSSTHSQLSIYPNPVKEKLLVSWDEWQQIEWELLDLQGKQIQSGMVNHTQFSVNMADVREGVYVLKVKMKDEVLIRKLLHTN